jgi:hypothetical protein
MLQTVSDPSSRQLPLLQTPPAYCAYASGPCDESFADLSAAQGLFLYGSQPKLIAGAIETAVSALNDRDAGQWSTWRDMDIAGHIVFCEVCKANRGASVVYADVTTLNFNLLFEIGFALGLGKPVRPIRDTTYSVDRKAFAALGVLDTLGYIDFTSGQALANAVLAEPAAMPLGPSPRRHAREAPLFLLKGPIDTDGAVRLMSLIKKSKIAFRAYDPIETPRLSLHAARKQVGSSLGVIAHLLSPNRDGAQVHNALCALLCGMAVAEEKVVVMLQEEDTVQPIDYRDLVQTYDTADQIESLIQEPLTLVVEGLQSAPALTGATAHGILDELDLGDVAAENEIRGLREYFVQTGRFRQVQQGHAQLVVGRKGAGKSALFYGLRDAVSRGREVLVLDMKPEGHQFTRLREAVLAGLSQGQQEYTLGAVWTYLLSAEVAHKILNNPSELRAAERDPVTYEAYKRLEDAFLAHGLASGEDLSQRLLRHIDRIVQRFDSHPEITERTDLRELIFGGDIRTLNDAVGEYLIREKDDVWLLIDNLDKSWATRGTTREDMLIMRGLLDAAQALQRQLDKRDVNFHSVVFVRTDIFEHLVERTPDRGKDSYVNLDWDDRELFREIVRARIVSSTSAEGSFEEVWPQVGPQLVGIENGFDYMLDRTLLRPRDLLMFLQDAMQVAIDRGHTQITAEDILQAEGGYSQDMLLALAFEIEDTKASTSDVVWGFEFGAKTLDPDAVATRLSQSGIPEDGHQAIIDLLLWYGFLGVRDNSSLEEQYSFEIRYNLRRLSNAIATKRAKYVIHPAFRAALSIQN